MVPCSYRVLASFVLVTAVLVFQETSGCGRSNNTGTPLPSMKFGCFNQLCGTCGPAIDVTLVLENSVFEPTFRINVTLEQHPKRELIHFLESAARKEKKFAFTSSFHHQFGHYVFKIGGQEARDDHYWIFYDHITGQSLNKGLSSHVPEHSDVILFNLTKYGH